MRIPPPLAAGAISLAAIVIVYFRAIFAFFFEDDFNWLATTAWAFHPSRIFDLGAYNHFYRPVIELYFWAATPLFGGSPVLFHLFNIALHAANGLLLFLIARQLGASDRQATLASLFFVVLPGYIEAVAWVGALAEPLSAVFGCLALYMLLRHLAAPSARRWIGSLLCFLLALLTHESAIVFLPILVLGAWWAPSPLRAARLVQVLAPYAVVAVVYLAIEIPITRRNYLVEQNLYTPGLHMVENVLGYIAALYVGKRNTASFVVIAAAIVLLLARGTPRVRFATCWMLLALMPFAPFTWGNMSRYLYLPAMGFGLLLAEGVEWFDRRLLSRATMPVRRVAVVMLSVAIAVRFMTFAIKGVENFAARTEMYRQFLAELRAQRPHLPHDTAVEISQAVDAKMAQRFIESAVQWEYQDPTLRVVVSPSPSSREDD